MKRVFVPGVFDVFHVGHLNYLTAAAQAGDYVIVGVQDDRNVLECKGIQPVIPLADRIAIIEALRCVDEVVSYTDVFQGPLLEGLNVDVFAVGEEYGNDDRYPDQKRTMKYCEDKGLEVCRIPRTDRVSSTNIRANLKQFWNSRADLQNELTAGVTVLGSFRGDQAKVDEETLVEVRMIQDAVGESKDRSLLDLGCGDGRQLVPLCEHFNEVTGVDFAGSLLAIAKKRLETEGQSADLVEADVSEYCAEGEFGTILLSGIIPCLDDVQMERMVQNIGKMSHAGTHLLIRSSIGLDKRVNVVSQFSKELKQRYTAYYRTVSEIGEVFQEAGWTAVRDQLLYQHREDTAVWWFEFKRS